jgi:SpoVK/Ycf46/Vps4 family AAA+-type ATPase
MKGLDELIFGIKAGYSMFYCESQEINKTITDIKEGLTAYYKENQNGIQYQVKTWDFETTNNMGESVYNNPEEMFNLLENISGMNDNVPVGTIVIAKNFNWFLVDQYGECDKTKTAWLLNRATKFSSPEYRKILIVTGNVPFEKAIPEILRRDFANIEFDLPNEQEIEKIYEFILDSAKENPKFVVPTEKEKARIIGGARGLTYSEIIKVFSYSIVKNAGRFDPKTVEELRAEEINGTPGLTIGKYSKKLEDLKGYEIAKEIVDEWIDDPEAKGVLLLGPAGVGKTHFCQSLASHYNRLIIEIEFAQLMGDGLVGQAEKAMKRALDVISANANPSAPIIVFVDEIEKGLAGTSGAGSGRGANDGGTTDRSNAQFLKFLSDARPKGIYLVASCNDIEKLPAAYVRAERWDTAPIFVDLPTKDEQDAILRHYLKEYGIAYLEGPKNMQGWTGAEIKTWCKLARKKIDKEKNPNDADELIVPINKTMSQEIDYLRQWKEGRTVPASRKAVQTISPSTRKLEI